MTDEELIAMFRATGDYQNAAIADRIAALRARVAELEQKLAAIRKEAETNQKWAFLEWRDRAEHAEAENARLRGALQFAVNQMRTVRDGKTGGIPNDIIALLPEAIEMADTALAALRGTK
jgi:hypothetical protein